MAVIEARLAAMGVDLPAPLVAPAGVRLPYEPLKVHGELAYVSGHGPFDGDRQLFRGQVGSDLTVEEGYDAARRAALSMFASLRQVLGDLDRVAEWVKVLGFVKCARGFDGTPSVVNGFSDLVLELWGDAGRHARSAIGADELPLGMPVEVEAIVRVTPDAAARTH